MQKFWIPKSYVPEGEHSKDEFTCMEIQVPEICQHCNQKLGISVAGWASRASMFYDSCEHFGMYNCVWENRIAAFKVPVDIINDGMRCSGVCGLWAHMAAPNQKDGTFKCYSCRNRGW